MNNEEFIVYTENTNLNVRVYSINEFICALQTQGITISTNIILRGLFTLTERSSTTTLGKVIQNKYKN